MRIPVYLRLAFEFELGLFPAVLEEARRATRRQAFSIFSTTATPSSTSSNAGAWPNTMPTIA